MAKVDSLIAIMEIYSHIPIFKLVKYDVNEVVLDSLDNRYRLVHNNTEFILPDYMNNGSIRLLFYTKVNLEEENVYILPVCENIERIGENKIELDFTRQTGVVPVIVDVKGILEYLKDELMVHITKHVIEKIYFNNSNFNRNKYVINEEFIIDQYSKINADLKDNITDILKNTIEGRLFIKNNINAINKIAKIIMKNSENEIIKYINNIDLII